MKRIMHTTNLVWTCSLMEVTDPAAGPPFWRFKSPCPFGRADVDACCRLCGNLRSQTISEGATDPEEDPAIVQLQADHDAAQPAENEPTPLDPIRPIIWPSSDGAGTGET